MCRLLTGDLSWIARSYWNNLPVLSLWGLASQEAAKSLRWGPHLVGWESVPAPGGHWPRMKPPKNLLVDGHPGGEVWVSWAFWLWLKQVEVVYRYGEGWNVFLEKLWRFSPWKGWLWDIWWYPQNSWKAKLFNGHIYTYTKLPFSRVRRCNSKPTGHTLTIEILVESCTWHSIQVFFGRCFRYIFIFTNVPSRSFYEPRLIGFYRCVGGPKIWCPNQWGKAPKKTLCDWIPSDAKIKCKLRQRKAFETEGAFHFVGISPPTRRIDALRMGFCSIFGGFFAIGFWCV